VGGDLEVEWREPASLRISKAVARIGGRPRRKRPLATLKVKWNTNGSKRLCGSSSQKGSGNHSGPGPSYLPQTLLSGWEYSAFQACLASDAALLEDYLETIRYRMERLPAAGVFI
jgi:hypothetical protein